MKYMLLICLLLACASGLAQETFDEHRARLVKEFSGFKSTIMDDYAGFRDQILQEYGEMLRQAWEKAEALTGTTHPIEELVPPVVFSEQGKERRHERRHRVEEVIQPLSPQPQPVPTVPLEPLPINTREVYCFSFMGTDMEVSKLKAAWPTLSSCDSEGIALFWKALSDRAYDSLVEECLQLRSVHCLCDWAYLLLLRQLSQELYVQHPDEAVLLMSYLYARSGYQMRLALTEKGQVCMLYATSHCIFNKSYWQIDGTTFYALDYEGDKIMLSNAALRGEKPLSLYVKTSQQLAIRPSGMRELHSEKYPEVKAAVACNLNKMDFFNTYPASMVNQNPCTRWAMVANAPLDELSKESLYSDLKQAIAGHSQLEAVERLLNFVQTAFVYEYDEKVWGYDRAFFAEETLFYPYCDCEDRSILFSRLVRDLLGLEVVLIYYPGHLATAVHFTDSVQGDYLLVDGQQFFICDPTYIGAPVGCTMTGMDNSSCKVIRLDE